VNRTLKVSFFCLWFLSLVAAAVWLATRRSLLHSQPARVVAASTPAAATLAAPVTPTAAPAANLSPTPIPAPPDPADASTFIAVRYDKTHVIFRLGEAGEFGPSDEQVQAFHKLPPPISEYGAAETWELNADVLPSLQQYFGNVGAGEHWQLELSSNSRLSVVTQKPVALKWGCDDFTYAAGYLAEITPQDQAAFAASPTNYFLVHKSSASFSPKSSEGQAGVGLLPNWNPAPAVRSQLKQVLNAQFKADLDDERLSGAYEGPRQRFEQHGGFGTVKLSYDVTAMQVSPDGYPLLFARARWTVDEHLLFATQLWLHVGPTVTTEPVDKISMHGGWFSPQSQLSEDQPSSDSVVNVFDRFGDGYGEVLVLFIGYEGYELRLYGYTPKGLVQTPISVGDGC
jgi:hypothetical protein